MPGPALLSCFVALAVTTVLLLAYGQMPMAGWSWRLQTAGALMVFSAVGAALSGSIEPLEAGAAIALLALAGPRRWYAYGALCFSSLVVTTVLYSVYQARAAILLAHDPVSMVLGLTLFLLEVGAMILILGTAFEMVDAICSQGREPSTPPPPDRWPIVCPQVPTYNEPPELVIETVRSLVAIDYPTLHVQVIDNNTTEPGLWQPVEEECARLRKAGHAVEFAHLPQWPGFKAGALNWGRQHLAPEIEILGVIDADYTVSPDWLRSVIAQFNDPAVAFVQTPQDYRSWETSAFYQACYVGLAYFFKVGMVSRDHWNAIIFAGTMGLIRRSVLDEVGGWDERIITEDAEVSLRVHARGYRSVYVPRAFGKGIMPLTYEGLRKQRFRWAFGGIQILRSHWRTLLFPHGRLTLGQRYAHLMGTLWWFNDLLTLGFTAFVAATALGAIVGRPFVVQRLTGLGIVLPTVFISICLIRYLWALRATTGAHLALAMAALRVNFSLGWVIAVACVRGLTQSQGVFLRTPKFAGAAAVREIRMVAVETAIGVSALGLLVLVLLRVGLGPLGLVLIGLLAWALLIYGSATLFALGDPDRAPIEDVLREKMTLELTPRVGRVIRSGPALASLFLGGLATAAIVAAVVSESARAPVSELPFRAVPAGPVQGPLLGIPAAPTLGPTPSSSAAASPSAPASASPASASPATTSSPPPSPTPAPPPASPSPARSAAPPTAAPTSSAAQSPVGGAAPSPGAS